MTSLRTALHCISATLCAIAFVAPATGRGRGTSAALRMLAAYFGYHNALGIADTNGNATIDAARAAGCNVKHIPGTSTLITNVRTPQQLAPLCMGNTVAPDNLIAVDGIPVSFSWAVLPATLRNETFNVPLSDGSRATAACVTLQAAIEEHELQTVLRASWQPQIKRRSAPREREHKPAVEGSDFRPDLPGN